MIIPKNFIYIWQPAWKKTMKRKVQKDKINEDKKGTSERVVNKSDNKTMLREQWRMLSKIWDQQYQRCVHNKLGRTTIS
jgi:hypothetical protein